MPMCAWVLVYQDDECTDKEFLRIWKYTEHTGYGVKHHHQAREVIVVTLLACGTSAPPWYIYIYVYIQFIEKSSYRKQEKHILLNSSAWACTHALKQKKKHRNQWELQLLIVFLFGRFLDEMLLLLLCTLVLLLYRCLHNIGAGGSWIRRTIRNRWRFCTLDILPPRLFFLDSWRQWGTKTEWLKVCGIGGD